MGNCIPCIPYRCVHVDELKPVVPAEAQVPSEGQSVIRTEEVKIDVASTGEPELFKGSMPPVDVMVHEVYDGDTIKVIVKREDLIRSPSTIISIRILGIDTPEKKPRKAGRTPESLAAEKEAAVLATKAMKDLVLAEPIKLELTKHDKFGGRFLGIPTLQDGTKLSDIMVRAGHAREYKGDKKIEFDDWYDKKKIIYDIFEAVKLVRAGR